MYTDCNQDSLAIASKPDLPAASASLAWRLHSRESHPTTRSHTSTSEPVEVARGRHIPIPAASERKRGPYLPIRHGGELQCLGVGYGTSLDTSTWRPTRPSVANRPAGKDARYFSQYSHNTTIIPGDYATFLPCRCRRPVTGLVRNLWGLIRRAPAPWRTTCHTATSAHLLRAMTKG